MAQCLPAMLISQMDTNWTTSAVPPVQLPIPINQSGKAKDDPSAEASPPCGKLDGVPGSWLWSGTATASVTIWEWNSGRKISLSLFSSQPNATTQRVTVLETQGYATLPCVYRFNALFPASRNLALLFRFGTRDQNPAFSNTIACAKLYATI